MLCPITCQVFLRGPPPLSLLRLKWRSNNVAEGTFVHGLIQRGLPCWGLEPNIFRLYLAHWGWRDQPQQNVSSAARCKNPDVRRCPLYGKLEQFEHPGSAIHTLHTPPFFLFFLRGTLVLIPPRQCQATSCVCSSKRGSALKHCGRWLQDSLVTKDKHGGEALARAPERSQSTVKRKANWTQRWTRGCSRFIVFPWKCCFRFA